LSVSQISQPAHQGLTATHFGHPPPSTPNLYTTACYPIWLYLGCLTLQMKAWWSFKMSGATLPLTQYHIPEDLNLPHVMQLVGLL